MSDPGKVIADTRAWLERVVIGLGLCPFAAAPHREDRIAYWVSTAGDRDGVYQDFLATLQQMLDAGPARAETGLLIVPDALGDFDGFLDMLGLLEQALVSAGLEGVMQIASFHPAYRFADAPEEDPANYSNRSPYPMFHLIREAGLSAALARYPYPEMIPQRNIQRLRELGLVGIEALLRD